MRNLKALALGDLAVVSAFKLDVTGYMRIDKKMRYLEALALGDLAVVSAFFVGLQLCC